MSETTHQIVLTAGCIAVAIFAFGLGYMRGSHSEMMKHLKTLKRFGAFMDATKAELERLKKEWPKPRSGQIERRRN